MRWRVLAVYALVIAMLLAGAWLGRHSVQAQAVTPAPWLSVAGPFRFCYRYPETIGCPFAEDKTGDPFVRGWKADVDRARADCLRWGEVGAVPAAQLSRDAACTGGTRLVGGIYWFDAPAGMTPTPPLPSPSISPTAPAATATFTPGATGTPSTQPPLGTVPPLITPIACYPALNIYGVDERVKWGNVPSVHYYVGNGCGALVVLLEGPTVITAYNRMLDELLEENLRRLVQRCLAQPDACKALLTPEAMP